MDLSFHNQQFGDVGATVPTDAVPRLSHARLMALVKGQTGLAMMQSWRSGYRRSQSARDSMTLRRALFAARKAEIVDRISLPCGSFCPSLASSNAAATDRSGKRELSVYQGGKSLGKTKTPNAVFGSSGRGPASASGGEGAPKDSSEMRK